MQTLHMFLDWLSTPLGKQFMGIAFVAGTAIVVAGIIAALIGRGATRSLLKSHEQERKASAIAALVHAGRLAGIYNTLSPVEQQIADRTAGDADVFVRLLPVRGAGNAATWAAHQIDELKIRSATFGYKADDALAEFRDRLVEWQYHPNRARKLFRSDLDRWNFESSVVDQRTVLQQEAWMSQKAAAPRVAPSAVAGDDAITSENPFGLQPTEVLATRA